MTESLLLAEQMALVSHDRDTGKFPSMLRFGLVPLLYVDLFLQDWVQVESDRHAVILKKEYTGDELLDEALSRLNTSRHNGLRTAVSRTIHCGEPEHVGHAAIEDKVTQRLIDRGLIKKQIKTQLGIFRSVRHPSTDREYYNSLLNEFAVSFIKPYEISPSSSAILLCLQHRLLLGALADRITKYTQHKLSSFHINTLKKELTQGIDWGTAQQRSQIRLLASLAHLVPRGG